MRVYTPTVLINSSVEGGNISATFGKTPDPKATINVFSKHFDKVENLVAIDAKDDLGYKAVFDVCDDHFDREHKEYYEAMIRRADLVTCNSANMQERIYSVTGKLAKVIPDPITFPDGEFKEYKKGAVPKVLWFGHSSNLGSLYEISSKNAAQITAYSEKLFRGIPNVNVQKWELGKVEEIIKDFDVVVIPTQNHPWARCKSPNRAVDALISGKYVITDSADIYGDLKKYVCINASLSEPNALDKELEYWSNNPEEISKKIKKGQEFVKKKYSSDAVLNGWLDVFKELGLISKYEDCA